MKIYRVAVVKKMVKYIEVVAGDGEAARISALSRGLGCDFSDCYFEYSAEGVEEIGRENVHLCEMPISGGQVTPYIIEGEKI